MATSYVVPQVYECRVDDDSSLGVGQNRAMAFASPRLRRATPRAFVQSISLFVCRAAERSD
eukprot:211175-Pyramimonas_sp.AAC.1